MACTFYEPAYVAIDQWFKERSARAIGVLTVVAGLSSAIFIPLSQRLVEIGGWRQATLALGGILLASVWALALLAVRDRPREQAEQARRKGLDAKAAYRAMLYGLRQTDRTFWLVSAAFFLALAGTFGMLFHQVAYLQDLGFPPGRVATVVGVIGITSLPARFVTPALAERARAPLLIAALFALLALSGLTLADARE